MSRSIAKSIYTYLEKSKPPRRQYKKTTRCKIESVNKNQDANEFPRKCVKYLVSFHIAAAPPL
jgi:hypothetical protein